MHPPAPTHNVLTTQLQQPPAKNLQDAFQQAFPEGRPARDSLHDVGVLDLLPALQPLLESLKEEGLPDDLSPEPDEEKVKSTVSSLFQGVHATATLSGIADAERATERARAVVLAYQDEQSEEADKARQKLKEAEASLAKIAKKKPSAAEEKVAVSLARDAYEAKVASRTAKVEAAAERFQTRTEWRRKYLANLEAQLAEAKTEVEDQEQTLRNAYEEKERCKLNFDSAVYAALEERLSQVEGGMSVDEPEPPSSPPPQLVTPDPEMTQLRAKNEEINKQLQEMTRLFKQLQQQMQAPTTTQQQQQQPLQTTASSASTSQTGAQSAKKEKEEEEKKERETAAAKKKECEADDLWAKECQRVDALNIDIKDLPAEVDLSTEALELLARTQAVLHRVSLHNSEVRITFDDTCLTTDILAALLGPIYKDLYGDEARGLREVPQRLPPRVLRLIGTALAKSTTRLAKAVETSKRDIEKEADNVFSAIISGSDVRQKPY